MQWWRRFIGVMMVVLAGNLLWATSPAEQHLPGAYCFKTPEAKTTWAKYLPEGSILVTPTCAYNTKDHTIYLLAEFCGLAEGYEVEFLLLGRLSDRAYEAAMIAWDDPSAIKKAATALGVPLGEEANAVRGMPMAQGERFTIEYAPLTEGPLTFVSIAEEIEDACSTASQNLFGRGFPYIGRSTEDDQMPCAIIATYTGCNALFGMPYHADKSGTYGLFRAKKERTYGTPVVVALRWQKLPNGQPRVCHQQLLLTEESITNTDQLIEELKAFCDNPADVFLDVRMEASLTLEAIRPVAQLLLAIEREGGYTILAPADNQVSVRAFSPKASWLNREGRLFQPWEIEIAPGEAGGPASVTLCQIEEDWSVEGPDPALTRHCYPNVKPETIASVMKRVDVNNGRVYVVFFYCQPQIKLQDLLPYAEAIKNECPTQWIFLQPSQKE